MASRSLLKELRKEHELIERYIKNDNHRSAMIYIDKILSQHPNEFKTLVYRSKCEMAEELYTEAEDTLTLAMELQPEKPLPAQAFVSLSEKFEVNDDRLFLALQIMRNFTMDRKEEIKYQKYSLKMLKLSIKLLKNSDFIRELSREIEELPLDVKFQMMLSFYERDPEMLFHDEAVFLFEYLGVQISTFSGNIDSDVVSLKLYKVFCDLGYKTNNISRLFDLSNSVFQSNSDAWTLHNELLNLALLEFCTKAADVLDVPQIDDNTADMLWKLAKMPDMEGNVKPTIRGVASTLCFLLENPNGMSLEKEDYGTQIKVSLTKLVNAYTSHHEDPLIGLLILFLLTRLKQPVNSTLAKAQDIRDKMNSNKKFSPQLRKKLLFFVDYLEILQMKHVSVAFNANEIIRRCDSLLCGSLNRDEVKISEEFLEGCLKDERHRKVFCIRSQASIVNNNEIAQDFSLALEPFLGYEDPCLYFLKAWANYHVKYNEERMTMQYIETGLLLKPEYIDLILFKTLVILEKLMSEDISNTENDKIKGASVESEIVPSLIEKCERVDPFLCETRYLYSLYYYLQGFLSEASQYASQCYNMNIMHLDSIKFYSRIIFESQNYEACISTYRSHLNYFPTKIQFQLWLKLGVELFYKNECDLATHCIAQCRVFDRNNYRSWLLISVIFYKTSRFHSALSCSLQTLKLLQQDSSFLVNDYKNNFDLKVAAFLAASCRLRLRKYAKASADFSTVALIDPSFLLALAEHVESLTGLSRSTGAKLNKSSNLDYFQSAVSLSFEVVQSFPRSAFAWKTMADTLLHSYDIDKNQLVQIPGIALSKNSRSIRVGKDVLMHMAYHAYSYVIFHGGFNSALAWLHLSRCCYFIGGRTFLSKSVQYARIAVTLDYDNCDLWLYLGCLCASDAIKKYDLAQISFLNAHKLSEESLTALGYLGFLYMKKQKLNKAFKMFEYIETREPSNALYMLFKQISQAKRTDATVAADIISPSFIIGSLECLEVKPSDNQMLITAKSLLEESERRRYKAGFCDSDVYYKVMNHLIVAVARRPCRWDLKFVLGNLFNEVASTEMALKCFSQVSNSMNKHKLMYLSSFVLRTLAAGSGSSLLEQMRGDQLETLFNCSLKSQTDKVNLHISLRLQKNGLYKKHKISIHNGDSIFTVPSAVFEILTDGHSNVMEDRNSTQKLQKLYFSTLNAKYLAKLCLKLFPQLYPSQMLHFIPKLQSVNQKDAVIDECIACCNMGAAIEMNNSTAAVAFAQKLVHRYPWIPMNWFILVYALKFDSFGKDEHHLLKEMIEEKFSEILTSTELLNMLNEF